MFYGQIDQLFAVTLFMEEIDTKLEEMYGETCFTVNGSEFVKNFSAHYVTKMIQKLPPEEQRGFEYEAKKQIDFINNRCNDYLKNFSV